MVVVAWRAYLRRRAWAAWNAGVGSHAGRPRELTFDKLAGITPAQQRPMSVEQMEANFRRFATAHNAALAARDSTERVTDGGQ